MYADRRFQFDRSFSYVAFSHEQVRSGVTGGYLLTNKSNFSNVADKILAVDMEALDNIIRRSSSGEYVQAETDAEKGCFELMSLVDHVSGGVHGSNARRKTQRSEIRSLIFTVGVPVFFITFAPADTKNPVCLSLCGEPLVLRSGSSGRLAEWQRMERVARNPVGAARFFHKTVNALLRILLRVGEREHGLLGDTSAYYGTVE
ncbi:hypothetical protein FKP32DRAFT_1547356, partial [Trametes sanguinea]